MKKLFCLAVFITAAILLFGSPVSAQLKIGYINSQRILNEFEEAKKVDKKLKQESERMAQDINNMKARLDSLMADYEKKQLVLSEQRKADMEQRMNQLYADLQQTQMEKFGEQGELAKLQQELFKPILDKIDVAIKEVGNEGNFDFIFDAANGNIVFAKEDKYDVTDLVLEKLK